MWPEDDYNDYSYMAIRKKYEDKELQQSNDALARAQKGIFQQILKEIG